MPFMSSAFLTVDSIVCALVTLTYLDYQALFLLVSTAIFLTLSWTFAYAQAIQLKLEKKEAKSAAMGAVAVTIIATLVLLFFIGLGKLASGPR